MRFLVVVTLAVAVAGCTDRASAKAERQLELVERNGATPREICEAKRKVAQAYLEEENAAEYQRANNFAEISCIRAKQEGY